jgi:SAM-dependent methyltransferase
LALAGCDLVNIAANDAAEIAEATVGLLRWANHDLEEFAEAIAPFRHVESLVLETVGQDRASLERILFGAGWQRHPAGMMVHDYPGWCRSTLPPVSYYRRSRSGSAELGMGVEADALIARYAMSANHVRPGDHVLVDGEGAGTGTAVLTALSRAGSLTSVVRNEVDDAKPGNAAAVVDASLIGVADNSIDLIVAFEPANPAGWLARLDDYLRILKHDGRLVLGWRRSLGDNARPRNWDALIEALSDRFLPEKRYAQVAISHDGAGPHAIFPIAMDQQDVAEWMLVVASANPLMGAAHRDEYDHPAFDRASRSAFVDFGAAYDNPYLYRSMVQMGERLGDDMKLARLAECVIEDSPVGSADRGAAIAVLGYRVLELRLPGTVPAILPLIADYVDQPLDEDTSVHVRRWQISLAFLAGRLSELIGDRAGARRWYRAAADSDWSRFSPLLATKAIAASFYEARICLADGMLEMARACFRKGVETALEAAAYPHSEQMGPADQPLSFYLQELAEVIDMGSQCANALANFSIWERDPGLFWRQVDVRRFGLASWARDLERENERLRAA